jgi:hypothetical protein
MDSYKIGISTKRRDWVVAWIERVLKLEAVEADYDSGLGRLSFVCGAIIFDRPFLAPLYAYGAKVRARTGRKVDLKRLPAYVRFTLLLLRSRLLSRHTIGCNLGRTRPGSVTERFRTDAKAEGDVVVVGGYQTRNGYGQEIPHEAARWFKLHLNRENAGWACAKGEPFKTIASLELLGTLLGIILLLEGDEDQEMRSGCSVSVGGITDNRGNRFAVAKLLTTKWPLAAFVAETAVQLEARGILLDVTWVPRELNTEADAITNSNTGWLKPELEIQVKFEELPFLILRELLSMGDEFQKDLEAVSTNDALVEPPAQKGPAALLKVRDPWD